MREDYRTIVTIHNSLYKKVRIDMNKQLRSKYSSWFRNKVYHELNNGILKSTRSMYLIDVKE